MWISQFQYYVGVFKSDVPNQIITSLRCITELREMVPQTTDLITNLSYLRDSIYQMIDLKRDSITRLERWYISSHEFANPIEWDSYNTLI